MVISGCQTLDYLPVLLNETVETNTLINKLNVCVQCVLFSTY